MTDITIPPEALEAAAIDLHCSEWGHDGYLWAEIDSETRDIFRQHARAACLAALKAWPGGVKGYRTDDGTPFLKLPLPKEPRDAE